MRKRYLVIGLVFLLVISSIGPLSFGNKLSEKENIIENYNSYNQREILVYNPISNYENNYCDIAESEKTNIVNEPFNHLNYPYEPDGVNSNQVYTLDEPPGIVWSKTYTKTGCDRAWSVEQTKDCGYIIGGYTNSYGGDWDALLIKTDNEGNELWSKTYGGVQEDIENCVVETSDGDLMIVGYTEYSVGKYGLWILKTDENGTIIWSKTYRNGNMVFGECIIETEHGYIVVSSANDDVWLVGIDENGDMIWNNTFGGIDSDWGYDVIQDENGGYVIVGTTYSFGNGFSDIWLIKTNETGVELWNKTFGGVEYDTGSDVIQTYDGGFAITGGITIYNGWRHFCLIKTNENGNELWMKIYEGKDFDVPYSVIQTLDKDFLIAGVTIPFTQEDDPNAWVIKVDKNGSKIWDIVYGGNEYDAATSIIELNDEEFITSGISENKKNGHDFWLVKIGYIPTVTIKKPKNGLYFMNSLIRPYLFRNPLIIGPIDIEAEVVDNKYEIEKVEFYANDKLLVTEISEPYSINWNQTGFGRFDIKVVAYNSHGLTGYSTIRVWKFF